MLKASALYIVIIVSLVIAVLCSSLITAAYFFRLQYQHLFRSEQLQNNLASGVNLLLASDDSTYEREKTLALFGTEQDSVSLQKVHWGIFEVGIVKAFIQKDTLYKTFMMGHQLDSSKWGALYIEDQDRPISVSGSTRINGDAYLPKAGIQSAYVDNFGYTGDKRIVSGTKHQSEKALPILDGNIILHLGANFKLNGDSVIRGDSINRSFTAPSKIYNFGKSVEQLEHMTLSGNIILCSDTTVVIDSTAKLNNVLVFAKAIVVKSGFSGKCQLFASDSISIGRHSRFLYPSCAGTIRIMKPVVLTAEKVTLNEGCFFSGIVFNYEKVPIDVKPLISIGKTDTIEGQIRAQGTLELKDKSVVLGNVTTGTLLYRTSFTQYENYLINVTLDQRALSPYYLGSGLLPGSSKKQKILQWLEGN
jgi:cytoskeletal protein CcmA (bactofilin family)